MNEWRGARKEAGPMNWFIGSVRPLRRRTARRQVSNLKIHCRQVLRPLQATAARTSNELFYLQKTLSRQSCLRNKNGVHKFMKIKIEVQQHSMDSAKKKSSKTITKNFKIAIKIDSVHTC